MILLILLSLIGFIGILGITGFIIFHKNNTRLADIGLRVFIVMFVLTSCFCFVALLFLSIRKY